MNDLSGKWYGARAGTTNTFRSVAFGNDRFVAVGDVGIIKVSFDPASFIWDRVEDKYIEARPLYSVSFDPAMKQFVTIGVNSLIAYSGTGSDWSVASFRNRGRIDAGGDLSAVACTNSRIILGCEDGSLFYSN
jgi:hypothetical protein